MTKAGCRPPRASFASSPVHGHYLAVPMLKDNELIGAIVIYRQEVRPFTDKQIELVQELRRSGRHRHREYAAAQRAKRESLEQQTATSEVLKIISSSPGDLNRCSRRCWRMPCEFARPSLAHVFDAKEMHFEPLPCMTRHQHLLKSGGAIQ